MRILCDGLDAYAHYSVGVKIGYRNQLLATGFFARQKTKVRAIKQSFGGDKSRVSVNKGRHTNYFETNLEKNWYGVLQPVNLGREHFTYCVAVSESVGKRYLFTSTDEQREDLYQFLMKNYKLPLLREWVPAICGEAERRSDGFTRVYGCIYYEDGQVPVIPIRERDIRLDQLVIYDFENMTEESLEEIVSKLLKNKVISFTQKEQQPLTFEGMDDYFVKYGSLAVANLTERIDPLTELKPNVTNLALKQKSLFPQQAASVEGIIAMWRNNIPYAVLTHGMGVGKTIEAASACEAIAVEKWLKAHPGKELKDAYEKEGIINYRTIIMAPGHLVEKWCQEIQEEIPYARATVLTELSQLTKLRENGRKAKGKEIYVVSKDTVKLGGQLSPIPTKMVHKYVALDMCEECADTDGKIVYKKGIGSDAHCPTCRGNKFRPVPISHLGKFHGLSCPECGEMLLTYKNINPESDKFLTETADFVLGPNEFSNPTQANSICYHCGASLWGISCSPLMMGDAVRKTKKHKWYKVSHSTNFTGKTKKTAWVLWGYEDLYTNKQKNTKDLREMDNPFGPRKIALSSYIKKYLKGYFDFCILDECHKYLGESAQAVSAHALVKASAFTMCLTGTISNGTAGCFYNLFYMLEPRRMKRLGYDYSSGEKDRFCKQFGCVETVYETECRDISRLQKNANSRGRVVVPAKVKPGISPVLFGKLLMDRCLFMDISDLSKYLPVFKEEVKIIDGWADIDRSYFKTLDCLSNAAKTGLGMSVLATQLQFGLNYLDKPFGRGPIKHPYVEKAIVCDVDNYEEFEDVDKLLPKEVELVNIINSELDEGRNCFVYCTATRDPESNITERLKAVIETHCSLKDRVDIIRSESPQASKREAYFHKKASEGIRVFITNPKCVETGLDFCFKHEGKEYNYPTLIFYQISYELATIWQASRRAYRLNQKEECRNFYLAYKNSLQVAALQIMGKKMTATAAIQGHFSAEGLSSMAQGVDARTLLAEALSKKDMGDDKELVGMFDVLNAQNNTKDEEDGTGFIPSKTFYELVGKSAVSSPLEEFDDVFAAFDTTFTEVSAKPVVEEEEDAFKKAFDALFEKQFDALFAGLLERMEPKVDEPVVVPITTTKSKKKSALEGQMNLLVANF